MDRACTVIPKVVLTVLICTLVSSADDGETFSANVTSFSIQAPQGGKISSHNNNGYGYLQRGRDGLYERSERQQQIGSGGLLRWWNGVLGDVIDNRASGTYNYRRYRNRESDRRGDGFRQSQFFLSANFTSTTSSTTTSTTTTTSSTTTTSTTPPPYFVYVRRKTYNSYNSYN